LHAGSSRQAEAIGREDDRTPRHAKPLATCLALLASLTFSATAEAKFRIARSLYVGWMPWAGPPTAASSRSLRFVYHARAGLLPLGFAEARARSAG